MRIYLAGPLFTCAEREFNARLKQELEKNNKHTVWLPQEHEDPDKPAKRILDDDVAAIRNAEVMVANMDGPDPDSGTSWECGYACAIGLYLIVFRTDFRAADKPGRGLFNPMLEASAKLPPLILPFANTEDVANAIDGELGKLPPPNRRP